MAERDVVIEAIPNTAQAHTNGHRQEAVFSSRPALALDSPPDVSILIPAHNAAVTLPKAIDSATQQGRVSVEIVVCDDASDDDTVELLAEYFEHGLIEVVRHRDNQGQAAALNSAAAIATGRYLLELDADDWLEPHSLAGLVYALDITPEPVGLAYGATQFHGLREGVYTPPPYLPGQFRYAFVSMYAFLYRRAAWECGCRYGMTYDAPDGRRPAVQDWDMALQLTEHMRYTAAVLPGQVVLHHQRSDDGLHGAIQAHKAAMLAQFKTRWPMVVAEDL